ncbi:alpha/beta-hydrolase [Acephala macrosclerotiorum]|nr:alpha/beta-hydrolase [Acephala macrosclerotiorum]
MEEIAAAIARHGNVWSLQTNEDMEGLYEPLHALRAEGFKNSVRVEKSLKYGPSERHRIDLYYPATAPTSPLPVVVFFHGGGFIAGDNDITPSMHGHIGNYFASNGCVCALATYRVIPEAKYPSGAEDVSLALKWTKENVKTRGGNPSEMTAIGQSAGAAHLASAIFTGKLKSMDVNLHGSVLLSAPLWYDLRQERRKKNMAAYHATDSEEEILAKTGVATFRSANVKDVSSSDILLMLGEFDSNEIVDGNLMFVEEYRKTFHKLPCLEIMKGHNHISYFLGIGLEGDKLGKRILEFVTGT